ncbi:heme degradation protein [Thiocystis violascens]|uniref:Putative heme degradation protein n=1 Tax=Thiocystis violascens (strain ATCC 17096 / DSM 198 / 6111) TaxID=765911 RepID=I3YG69_THIV6|nr:heme degradation protein [Thiocystis violascens]AFL75987.1 putative heme degradation protein [Thiocystis violascens DSM 198]
MTAVTQLMSASHRATFALSNPLAPEHATHALRLTGHWPELLWDLACLDRVWIETATPEISLAQMAPLLGIRVHQDIGLATGRRLALHLFLEQWHALRILPEDGGTEPRRLCFENRQGTALLTLSLDPRANGFALRTLARTHRAERERAIPLPRRPDFWTSQAHPLFVQALAERWPDDAGTSAFTDIAEICGWLRLIPARLRDQGRITLVDPELIPCFLETLTEQALPVRVLAGTAGVAHRFDGAFHIHQRLEGNWLQLLGDQARLRLDLGAIDSAWVFQPAGTGASAPRRQLRLYDESGRALALIDDLPRVGGTENPIWRTLINALFD